MENISQTQDCNDYCGAGGITINGGNICTSTLFTLSGLAPNSSVTWSASPSGMVQFSCTTCLQPTISAVGNGTVTITANITSSCGNASVSKQVTVGFPSVYGTYIDRNGEHPLQYWDGNATSYNPVCNQYTAQTNLYIPGANLVVWSKINSNRIIFPGINTMPTTLAFIFGQLVKPRFLKLMLLIAAVL